MTVYLAARYSRYPEMQAVRALLHTAGHIVTSRWINGEHQASDASLTDDSSAGLVARFAQEDLEDLIAADCVLSFTEEPRTTTSRGGRHVEYGYALALGKRCCIVGPRENVFHCLSRVEQYETAEDALGALGGGHA